MTTAYTPRPVGIFTTLPQPDTDAFYGVLRNAIDTIDFQGACPSVRRGTVSNLTRADAVSDENEWIRRTLPQLDQLAALPAGWDSEGSPSIKHAVLDATRHLLGRLLESCLGMIPTPFVCPVAGGTLQLEWNSPTRHLELEILASRTVVFLTEEATADGDVMNSGEYPVEDVEKTRQLLDWFSTV